MPIKILIIQSCFLRSSERSEEVCGSQFRTRDLVQAYGSNVLAFLVSFMNDEEQRKASSPGFAFVFNGYSGETLEPSNIHDNLMEVSIEIIEEDEKPTEPRRAYKFNRFIYLKILIV